MTMPPPVLSGSPVLMTATEFTARYENRHAELIRGVVRTYPGSGLKQGIVCGQLIGLFGQHVERHSLGHLTSNDSWIQTAQNPDSIRGADLCFFTYERLPKGPIPDGLLTVSPELVVEVRPSALRWLDVFCKVPEYLGVGVTAVVILDLESQTASVYRDSRCPQKFSQQDTLTLPDVLPGFSVPIERLFA